MCGICLPPSHIGCAWDGGCLLASLSTDSVLIVWTPSLESKALHWEQVCTLSDLWAAYIFSRNFQVGEEGEEKNDDASAVSTLDDHVFGRDERESRLLLMMYVRLPPPVFQQANMNGKSSSSKEDGKGYVDVNTWAYRQKLVSIDAIAWAKDRFPASSSFPLAHTLLAAGGPEALALWLFTQGEKLDASFTPNSQPVACLKVKDVSHLAWSCAHEVKKRDQTSQLKAYLAIGSAYGAIELLQVVGLGEEWEISRQRTLVGPDIGSIQCIQFTQEWPHVGETLFAAKGTTIQAWSLPNGNLISTPLEAHANLVTALDFTYGLDGSGPHIVTSGLDGQIKVRRHRKKAWAPRMV